MQVSRHADLICTTTCAETTIDDDWDARVEATPGGDLTQTTLWAASRQQLGFRSYHIAVRDTNASLVGGCIVYARRFAPGIWAGSIPRGPLLFAANQLAATAVLRATAIAASRHRIRLLIVQPPEGSPHIARAMDALGYRVVPLSIAPEATSRLNLAQTDEELLQAMTSNRRRDIRNALRANIVVREESDLDLFHRLHASTATRQKFTAVTRDNLQAQWQHLAPSAKCAMFIARCGGIPVAGIWLTRFAEAVTFKLTGWDATAAASHANEALHWTAIRWARERGARTYDFGGIDRDSAELLLAGLPAKDGFNRTPSFFKQRFGGMPVLLPRAQFVFTQQPVSFVLGSATRGLLSSNRLRKIANRLRNGRPSR